VFWNFDSRSTVIFWGERFLKMTLRNAPSFGSISKPVVQMGVFWKGVGKLKSLAMLQNPLQGNAASTSIFHPWILRVGGGVGSG
jgi:hypothetical protein